MKKRKNGHYWIRYGRIWEVAKWDREQNEWRSAIWGARDPDDIDERRIVRPKRVKK